MVKSDKTNTYTYYTNIHVMKYFKIFIKSMHRDTLEVPENDAPKNTVEIPDVRRAVS